MIENYDIVICCRGGHIVFRFETPEYQAVGWCLSAVFQTWSDGRLAAVIDQVLAIKNGALIGCVFGGSEMEVNVVAEKVEIRIPYQDPEDFDRDSTFVVPFSKFYDAIIAWGEFLRRYG